MHNTKALLISLGAALFGTLMVFGYISQLEDRLKKDYTLVKTVVAAKDIPAGTLLDETWLKIDEIPKKAVQTGHLDNIKNAVNRITLIPILQNTAVLETFFLDADSGIAAKVPNGQRAFSIPVSEATAVADLIEPQDFVDVMVTAAIGSFMEGKNVTEEIITRTVLQNIRVLAVNRVTSRASRMASMSANQSSEGNIFSIADTGKNKRQDISTITLAVSPEDTQKLSLAVKIGLVAVSLRSKYDKGETAELKNLDTRELLQIEKKVLLWPDIGGNR
ncbi:Flp pilus assembly protein CpaB [Desulfococcaceae bacterium HSG7]|nr:Flp pilus assembly protein CpaB [Desulfococcaceae bacterium HSG7]